MKELNIEEKAKRYDEAYKRVVVRFGTNVADEIFPELKESEDEKIKKEIKVILANTNFSQFALDYTFADMIAWLEKQGGQEPVEWKQENTEILTPFENAMIHIGNSFFGKNAGLNPNDTYAVKEQADILLEIAKQNPIEPNWVHHKVDLSDCSEEYRKAYYDGWNNCNQQHSQLQAEQKPIEWSEEDKIKLNDVIRLIEDSGNVASIRNHYIAWLKSLRPHKQYGYNPYKEVVESIVEMCDRYASPTSNLSDFLDNVKVKCKEAKEYDALFPQKQWKPSEEQMKALSNALSLAKNCGEESAFDLRTLYEQLKAL